MRLGLCCLFGVEPITFRTTTATSLGKLPRAAHLENSRRSLLTTPPLCWRRSTIFASIALAQVFTACKNSVERLGVRLALHPDQFVVLNSSREDVVQSSIIELEFQAEVAEWIGADVINIHAGGVYGDKPRAIKNWHDGFARLSTPACSNV